MEIEELLNSLPLDDLRQIAHFNNLLDKGAKRELVSVILAGNLAPERILGFASIGSLRQLLSDEGLPRSGRRGELEKRLLSIMEEPGKKHVTAYRKGHEFEEDVASWAREIFKEYSPRIQTRDLATGLSKKRPYEIDVHVQCKGKGLFAGSGDIWIECKKKEKSSVKSTDIMLLVAKAKDVYQAAKAGKNELFYNGLIVVSNQRFDIDALNYANQAGVLCIRFDGKRYEEQNQPKTWLGKPPWLKQVEYT